MNLKIKVREKLGKVEGRGRLRKKESRKSDPDIMVVQPAEDRQGYNSSDRMDGSGYRSVLDKGQMRSSDVVVFRIGAEHITQMSLAEDGDLINALPSDRADQP